MSNDSVLQQENLESKNDQDCMENIVAEHVSFVIATVGEQDLRRVRFHKHSVVDAFSQCMAFAQDSDLWMK